MDGRDEVERQRMEKFSPGSNGMEKRCGLGWLVTERVTTFLKLIQFNILLLINKSHNLKLKAVTITLTLWPTFLGYVNF